MGDHTNDINALLLYLRTGRTPNWYECSTRWHAALTALVAERDAYKARCKAQHEVMTDMVAERDEYKKALHEISTQDYRGNGSQESHIARRVLAAMRKEEA